MGLDMYAYTTPVKPISQVDFVIPDYIDADYEGTTVKIKSDIELYYWRKHWPLHMVMKQIYLKKGGKYKDFNCVSLQLLESDLDYIENVINVGLEVDPERLYNDKASDLEFIEKAKKALQEGLTVYYYAWY